MFRYDLSFSFGGIPTTLIHSHNSTYDRRRPDTRGARPFLPHSHSHVEFQYVIDGQGTVSTPGQAIDLRPGQLLIIPPRLEHRLTVTSSHLLRQTLSMLFLPSSSHVPSEFDPLFSLCRGKELVTLDVAPDSPLADCLMSLHALTDILPPDGLTQELIRGYCLLFLSHLTHSLPVVTPPDVRSAEAPITREREIMDSFFQHEFSLRNNAADLARRLHISTRQLSRILQDTYGMTFREIMTARRLTIAVDRLTNSNDPLAQIAEFLGFGGPTAFGIFIKKETGLTPSQIRHGQQNTIEL